MYYKIQIFPLWPIKIPSLNTAKLSTSARLAIIQVILLHCHSALASLALLNVLLLGGELNTKTVRTPSSLRIHLDGPNSTGLTKHSMF